MTAHSFRRASLRLAKIVSCAVLALAGVVLTINLLGNEHEVDPGHLYRSGQLSGTQLHDYAAEHGIKAVLNLRGPNPGKPWYDEEIRASQADHLVHIDYAISARRDLTPAQMDDLVKILHDAPKPLLVHCNAGADRTGLVSALYELDRGQDARQASEQLSVLYGHFPWLGSRSVAMDRSFAVYAAAHPAHR